MAGEQNVVRPGAAAIIEDDEGRILMEKRNVFPKGMWVLPGGGIEFGETSEKAVVREVLEETGLNIKLQRLVKVYEMIVPENKVHRIIFFYKARSSGGKIVPSDDAAELKWLTTKEILKLDNLGHATIPILKEAGLLK